MNADLHTDLIRDPATLTALRSLEAGVDAGGWDQPARLFTLHRDSHDRLHPVEITAAAAFGDVHPVRIIRALAAALSRVPTDPGSGLTEAMLDSIDIHAWVLLSEAWMVDAPADNAAGALAAADERLLHLHPHRVEIRTVNAVDRGGRVEVLIRRRGQDLASTPPGSELSGSVLEALRALMTATVRMSAGGAR